MKNSIKRKKKIAGWSKKHLLKMLGVEPDWLFLYVCTELILIFFVNYIEIILFAKKNKLVESEKSLKFN